MSCYTIFPYKLSLFPNPQLIVNLTGCTTGPCPKCGGIGEVQDGVYNFINEATEIVNNNKDSIPQLKSFSHILQNAVSSGIDQNTLEKEVNEKSPLFSKLLKFIPSKPEQIVTLVTIVGIIISAVADISSLLKEEITPTQVIQVIYNNNVVNNTTTINFNTSEFNSDKRE